MFFYYCQFLTHAFFTCILRFVATGSTWSLVAFNILWSCSMFEHVHTSASQSFSAKWRIINFFLFEWLHKQNLSFSPEEAGCSETFCDEQLIIEVMSCNEVCGCYSFVFSRKNKIIDHIISIEYILFVKKRARLTSVLLFFIFLTKLQYLFIMIMHLC